MRRISIMIAAAAALSAASCVNMEMQEEFMHGDGAVGLSIRGETVFEYTENGCQVGYDASALEFRASDDSMNDYFVLKIDRIPAPDSETVGTLVYTTSDDIVTKNGLRLRLVRSDGDRLWFWNRKNSIGVVVRTL